MIENFTRTKIVCTIGPSTLSQEMLEKLILAGMDVARLNMSHANHEQHAKTIERIQSASKKVGKQVAILVDLQGPKIRVGDMPNEGLLIHNEDIVRLTIDDIEGYQIEDRDDIVSFVIPVRYPNLTRDVRPHERILLNDGLMEFEALEISETFMLCKVITGGVLTSNKGLNLPGSNLTVRPITEKDWRDLDFAIEQKADWVALSFVRTAGDVNALKRHISERNPEKDVNQIKVIAKIEKPEALDSIEQIIQASDGIMVARGDLGIEIAAERLPMEQKRLIRLSNEAGKPVITATQMLDSMIRNPRPTRAEASDVANAILDGTDAIMLSGETANGKFPIEAVETMMRIAGAVEEELIKKEWASPIHIASSSYDVTEAVAHATCETAYHLGAAAIITATSSGKTARDVCKYRPYVPIIAISPNGITQRQLMLSWGVIPLKSEEVSSTGQVISNAIERAAEENLVGEDDLVVITAGVANNMPGTTNMMRVDVVGKHKS